MGQLLQPDTGRVLSSLQMPEMANNQHTYPGKVSQQLGGISLISSLFVAPASNVVAILIAYSHTIASLD